MAVDKRIELEIALRDSVSLTLKVIADNLENINKAMAKSGPGKGDDGADAFRKIKETTEGIRKASEEGAKSALGAGEAMLPVAATLLRGAVGRLAVWAAVVKFTTDAITDQARERQEWASIAEDTNLKEGFVSMLAQAQRKLGIEPPQAKANIMNIMKSINDMGYGRGGQLRKELGRIGEGELGNKMEELVMGGKGQEALQTLIERYDELEKTDAEKALKLADAAKIPPSFFKGLSAELKTVKPAFEISLESANAFMIRWTNIMTVGTNAMNALKNVATVAANRAPGVIASSLGILGTMFDALWHARGSPFHPFDATIPDSELEAFKERNKETLELLKQILTIYQRDQNKKSLEKRWVGGSVLPGRDYLVGERGPETLTSGGSSRMVGAGGPEVLRVDHPSSIDPFTAPPGHNPIFGDDSGDSDRNAMWRRVRPERAVPGDPEETWNRLNRRLNKQPWLGYSESGILPGEGNQPDSDITLHNALKYREREMEKEQQIPKSEEGFLPRGGKPGEFYNPYTGEAQGQPINYRSMMDNEIGGGGDAGSLGAEIIFRNVPEGVVTDADADGFDNFTVNKTRQLQS